MDPLKITFTRALRRNTGFSIFWLVFFAMAIADNRQRRDEERRKKRDRQAKPPRKPRQPTAGPRPF